MSFIFRFLIHYPDLNKRILFPVESKSNNVKTCASKVNEQPKFLPTIHCHSPSP